MNLGDGFAHERADEYERGRGGVAGNRRKQRRAEKCRAKKSSDEQISEARACPGRDPRSAFDVTRYGGRSRCCAENCAEGVRQQRAARARQLAVAKEFSLFAHADERSHVVEEIHEKENENQLDQSKACRSADIELEQRASGMRKREDVRRPLAEPAQKTGKSRDDDAN